VAATYFVAAGTLPYEGRYLYVGVAGFATLMVVGTEAVTSRIPRVGSAIGLMLWPAILAGLLTWVGLTYVFPLAGL
jgi:hypothetical protein